MHVKVYLQRPIIFLCWICLGCMVYNCNNQVLRSIKKTKPYFSYFSTSNHNTCSLVHQHIYRQFRDAGWQAMPSLATR